MITRRKLLLALGAVTLTTPLRSMSQQPQKVWRLGFLAVRPRPSSVESDIAFGAFFVRLRELGYIEGKNLVIEWRSADGQIERYAALASELVNLKVDAILAGGGDASVKAAQLATRSVPIILASSANAVADGFVKSLAKPEGNVTGVSLQSGEIAPKVIEILHTMIPRMSRLAVLVKPDGFAPEATNTDELSNIRGAARKLDIKLIELPVRSAEDLEPVMSRLKPGEAQGLLVMSGPFFNSQRERICTLALKAKLASGFSQRSFVDAGGLISYGPSIADAWALSATYVDKLFKGAKPGELPIQQPTKFYLHINRKTAKSLGITIPKEILLRADEVIE